MNAGVTFYRTFDNIKKGANLTIHCLLLGLEKWREKHGGKYPEELYIQIDGGSENANRWVLAMCELLVVTGCCRLVVLSRLPTGHTHEDIDATFAHLWRWMRTQIICTVQEFASKVEATFKNSKLQATVEDVYVIPDFQEFFSGCIDPLIANYTKEEQTQHVWKFESINISRDFPLGCKVMYRAYASSKVVEIIERPKHQCLTNLGQLTGLEAVTAVCKWYPDGSEPEGRPGVDGMYLLQQRPNAERFIPCKFDPEGENGFKAAVNCAEDFWKSPTHKSISECWRKWVEEYCPMGLTAEEYVAFHPSLYKIPLFEVLSNPERMNIARWGPPLPSDVLISEDFAFPDQIVVCMPSVTSSLHRHPPSPRIYAIKTIVADYMDRSSPHYQQLKDLKAEMVTMLERKIDNVGDRPKFKDTKAGCILALEELDRMYLSIMLNPLNDHEAVPLKFIMEGSWRADQEYANSLPPLQVNCRNRVSTHDFRRLVEFKRGRFLSKATIDYFMDLFQNREDDNVAANVKKNSESASKWVLNAFHPALSIEQINEQCVCSLLSRLSSLAAKVHFIPFLRADSSSGCNRWCGLRVDFKNFKVSICDPCYSMKDLEAAHDFKILFDSVKRWISTWRTEPSTTTRVVWKFVKVCAGADAFFEFCEYVQDSGLHLLTIFELSYNDMPIAYRCEDIETLRIHFCNQAMQGQAYWGYSNTWKLK